MKPAAVVEKQKAEAAPDPDAPVQVRMLEPLRDMLAGRTRTAGETVDVPRAEALVWVLTGWATPHEWAPQAAEVRQAAPIALARIEQLCSARGTPRALWPTVPRTARLFAGLLARIEQYMGEAKGAA